MQLRKNKIKTLKKNIVYDLFILSFIYLQMYKLCIYNINQGNILLLSEGKKESFAGEFLIKHSHIINLTAASFILKQIQNYIKTVLS